MRWLDGITNSWTWVWASSGSWEWTGKLGMLQSMGLQSQIDWATELTDWLAIGLSVVSRLKEEEKRILLDRGVEYWTTIKMLAEEQIYSIYRLVLNSFSKSREPAPLTGPRKQYFPGWPGKRKYKFALVFPSPFQKPGIRREKGRKWVIWKINWIRASKR